MKKVTYFDVEYANNKNKSICQMGIMCENFENGEPIYPERDIYINPEDGFDTNCIQIHGICYDTVKQESTLPTVWKEIEKYFTNSIIIGHNIACSDLDALSKSLKRYNIDIPEFYYVDTLEIARNCVQPCYIKNYSMSALCFYFNISIDCEHNAFDDACANADLLKELIRNYDINIENYTRRYIERETKDFIKYISNPIIRKTMSEFYGTISGILIDNKVNQKEYDFIVNWKEENKQYDACNEIKTLIDALENVVSDGIITAEEMKNIRSTVKQYVDNIDCSQITLSTQILSGILKGISCDKEISTEECQKLREWLYENNYLQGHYPFDKVLETLNIVLQNNILSIQESELILNQIEELINPVENMKGQIFNVENKHVCLSGNFCFGQKSAVEQYITKRDGIIDKSINKATDFLLIGALECESYSNGTYGTKVKKAIEYNNKGCNIIIIKEEDFFKSVK